ncbi:hypothetical protein MBGDF03_00165 [Thermoplasmatales archaeon SCGC AB-540-F20]|nr:hypothetical protein MBGDF03_00165 [Thermoplasmatales archaeon SCGC AB-540-F20]
MENKQTLVFFNHRQHQHQMNVDYWEIPFLVLHLLKLTLYNILRSVQSYKKMRLYLSISELLLLTSILLIKSHKTKEILGTNLQLYLIQCRYLRGSYVFQYNLLNINIFGGFSKKPDDCLESKKITFLNSIQKVCLFHFLQRAFSFFIGF